MAFGGIMIPNDDEADQILEIDEYPKKNSKDKSKSKKPPKTTMNQSRTGALYPH